MPPKVKHPNAVHGVGNIPAPTQPVPPPLPSGVLIEDVFDARGMPKRLVPPPCPPNERMIFIVGQHGGLHWYNVNTKQMYTRGPVANNVPRIVCSTLLFPPKERPKRASQKPGNVRVVPKCPGRMVPAIQHEHPNVIDHGILQYHLYDMAMRALFTLHGDGLRNEQIRLFADYFCLMLIRVPFLESGLTLLPKKFSTLGQTRVMYPDESKRFPERNLPITDYTIQDVPSLAEAIIRVLWVRGGDIIDIIEPALTLSHPGSRELGFPVRDAEYVLRLPVPGNFAYFISIL